MLRTPGQHTLQCDACGAQFDDRPRFRSNNPRALAAKDGWTHLNGEDFCSSCSDTFPRPGEAYGHDPYEHARQRYREHYGVVAAMSAFPLPDSVKFGKGGTLVDSGIWGTIVDSGEGGTHV